MEEQKINNIEIRSEEIEEILGRLPTGSSPWNYC